VPIEIVEQPISALPEHARVSIAFQVEDILHIEETGNSLVFVDRRVDHPYVKNYDELEPPHTWSERFDISRWGLLVAFVDGKRVGGAVIAVETPELTILDDRKDVAALWDIRVDPARRRQGIGTALFRAAEDWAASRKCKELRIETQNTNLAACRFYEGLWCRLRAINPGVYPGRPDEIQLIWSRRPRPL
jgi:ribosomal protein S18 acetylase RimI-like enzyme